LFVAHISIFFVIFLFQYHMVGPQNIVVSHMLKKAGKHCFKQYRNLL